MIMKVKDVMHGGVAWVSPDAPLPKIAAIMRKEDVGAVPVGENDRLIGMVTDRDIALRGLSNGRDPLKMTAREVMTGPITYCLAEEDVEDAVRLMEQKKIRRLPVIGSNKRMVGMLSLGDVAAIASTSLCNETMRAVSAHHA
jgi:CBS domain-containing protein